MVRRRRSERGAANLVLAKRLTKIFFVTLVLFVLSVISSCRRAVASS